MLTRPQEIVCGILLIVLLFLILIYLYFTHGTTKGMEEPVRSIVSSRRKGLFVLCFILVYAIIQLLFDIPSGVD